MGPAFFADTEVDATGHNAVAWAGRAADVQPEWFAHSSWLHGVRHTQRVHIRVRRLVRELRWPNADVNIVLPAALRHDIGRVNDGWEPGHGAQSAARVVDLGLHASLSAAEARLALFAIRYHSRSDERGLERAVDQDDRERALRILWLLKDADALDRGRLGGGACEVDPSALRHECTVGMVRFADGLLAALP